MGMGFAKLVLWEWEWEWERMKTLHFPISSPQIADYQILLMDSCFGIVICHRQLGFTLDVHETLRALTL